MPRPTAEQIFRGMTRAPLTTKANSRSNQFAGITTVDSGVTSVVVSTTAISSDDIVMTSLYSTVASNATQVVRVGSINVGNFFTFAINPGPVGTDFSIRWIIYKTN